MRNDDDIDEEEERGLRIPQGNSPYRRGLWAEAYQWVCWLLSIFGDVNELRVKGLSRRWGLKLSNWLWGIEGAVRRLVLAAALAMDVKDLPEAKANNSRRTKARPPGNRRPVFRVLRVHGAGRASSARPQAAKAAIAPRPYGHIPFPADQLLALGEPRRGMQSVPGPRQRNPLDRWVRPSRQDPDYRPRGETGDETGEETGERFDVAHPARPARRRKARQLPPPSKPPEGLPKSLYDWRRVHDEWEKIIPAQAFAARIYALQRVMADPEALIARTAQRLQMIRDRVAALVKEALPLLRRPRRDKTPPSSETNLLAARCHGAIVHPDTS